MKRDNTYLHGCTNPNAKLSSEDVEWLKKHGVNYSSRQLAKRFNVDRSTISRVIRGATHNEPA